MCHLSSFITFRSCRTLDGKHTVFGKLVGGAETLNELEKIEVDNKDRPIEDIIIEKVHVFVDPFEEVDEQLAKERADAVAATQIEEDAKQARAPQKKDQKLTVFREGIGKYLNTNTIKGVGKNQPSTSGAGNPDDKTIVAAPPKKQKRYDFGGFKTW